MVPHREGCEMTRGEGQGRGRGRGKGGKLMSMLQTREKEEHSRGGCHCCAHSHLCEISLRKWIKYCTEA